MDTYTPTNGKIFRHMMRFDRHGQSILVFRETPNSFAILFAPGE